MQCHGLVAIALGAGFLVACGGGRVGDDASAGEVGVVDQELVVCPDMGTLEGIDVSYYQGNIDWAAVAASGRRFAITRVNHGDFFDPEFADNWAGIKDAGLIRGAYQYFEPGEDVDFQAQVMIDNVGVLGPGDLPVVLDVETTSGGVPPAQITAAIHQWIDKVEPATGKRPLIYTGKYFWNDYVQTADFADYPLWIAAYGPPCPDTPTAWDTWAMWQYSSTGSVPGIGGDCDLNVFNGNDAMLNQLAGNLWGAEVVSVTAPDILEVGETGTATIVVTNLGIAWDGSTKLGTTEPRDRASAFRAATWESDNRAAVVSGPIAFGETYTFEIDLVAPDEPGQYVEHFGLVQETVAWFSDAGQGGPNDDVIALTIDVVPAGEGSGGAGASGSGSGGEDPVGGGPADPKAGLPADDGDVTGSCACSTPGGDGTDSRGLAALVLLGAAITAGRRGGASLRSRARDPRRTRATA